MPPIVLTTLNATYAHAAFGLRYLLANLPEDLQTITAIWEATINHSPLEVTAHLISLNPHTVGFGVYIWNTTQTAHVITLLKTLRPDITVILGGPEVSYETLDQPITALADFIITQEAEAALPVLLRQIIATKNVEQSFNNQTPKRSPEVIHGGAPPIEGLIMPYDLYTDEDIAHRVVYVEASRGCPFKCEFCLSSLDKGVRKFALEPFLAAMQRLLDRGLNQFKFVDRTFNLSIDTSKAILEFFLARDRPGLFVHFELVPDRLPVALREVIARFRPGVLQFEVGIQTWNPAVAARISRRQDYEKVVDNLRFLVEQTGVHIHADLIVGLPGEGWDSFGEGFNKLVGLGVHEVQVGLLKRLRGTPIVRHDREWGMCYSPLPPYELLQSKALRFEEVQALKRFARCWDQVANSGRFPDVTRALNDNPAGPFAAWTGLAARVGERLGGGDVVGVRLDRWAELLFAHLSEGLGMDAVQAARLVLGDYWRGGKRDDVPRALQDAVARGDVARPRKQRGAQPSAPHGMPGGAKRQAQHLEGSSGAEKEGGDGRR